MTVTSHGLLRLNVLEPSAGSSIHHCYKLQQSPFARTDLDFSQGLDHLLLLPPADYKHQVARVGAESGEQLLQRLRGHGHALQLNTARETRR